MKSISYILVLVGRYSFSEVCRRLVIIYINKLIVLTAMLLWTLVVGAESHSAVDDYRLAAGDELRITVYGHPDLSGSFEVDGNGQLSLPLIQDIDVGKKTLNEVEALITNKLKPDYLINPRVSVQILNHSPFYIVGEVNEPGSYPYVEGISVLNAVAMAGGFTYRAHKGEIAIIRVGKTDEGNDGKEKIDATTDTLIFPGDVIEVGERFF
jgi:protein involved in polysaccharide export with SLBB domain